MLQPMTDAIAPDEVHLARLACAKLVRLVEGALTVGLPALTTGVPEPRSFFEERFRVLAAFALVLHSVSVKPGSAAAMPRLRERSAKLLTAVQELQRQLLDRVDTPAGASRSLQPVQNAISALCDALEEYGQLIGQDGSPIARVKGIVLQVIQSLEGQTFFPESAAV